jgi:hypothetical protein
MTNKIKMMYSEFSQPDKSKRAEKMLELAIPSLFRLR